MVLKDREVGRKREREGWRGKMREGKREGEREKEIDRDKEERSVLGLARLYSVGLEILLQLPYPDLGHIELVLDLPQVGVADRILASMVPQDILCFVHCTTEGQGFSHAL